MNPGARLVKRRLLPVDALDVQRRGDGDGRRIVVDLSTTLNNNTLIMNKVFGFGKFKKLFQKTVKKGINFENLYN